MLRSTLNYCESHLPNPLQLAVYPQMSESVGTVWRKGSAIDVTDKQRADAVTGALSIYVE